MPPRILAASLATLLTAAAFAPAGFAPAAFAAPAAPAASDPAASNPAVLAPVHRFIASVNAGDMKAAASVFTPDATIIDEFPPFLWHGHAVAGWSRDYDTFAKGAGMVPGKITLAAPSGLQTGAGHAYAVIPAEIALTVKGKPTTEAGSFTFVLTRQHGPWRIAAWAWAAR